jgi:hypothetical protein
MCGGKIVTFLNSVTNMAQWKQKSTISGGRMFSLPKRKPHVRSSEDGVSGSGAD